MSATRLALALGGILVHGTGAGAVGPDVPPFGLGAFERDEPISITADKLEAQDGEGRRTLAFRHNVKVRQGPLGLDAQVLEARYAAGRKEPDTLRARGDVRIREGARRARCREAHYDRLAQRLLCRGEPAELWDGQDRLSGGEVAFDLEHQAVHVTQGARLEIHRDLSENLDADEQLGLGEEGERVLERVREGGPVRIRASELEASETGSGRRIALRGEVRVEQDTVTLDSEELEVVYPAGARRPERLIARRDVVIRDGDREARCELAEYHPDLQHVACSGEARVREADDFLTGDHIDFDFEARRVVARGNARLRVDPSRHDLESR